MEFKVKREKLTNGLRLLTVPMETESVTALLLVRVGSRDESAQINGLSHFVEHMVFKGTQKWPTTQAVNKVIDSVGGVFNAFTGQEYTGFWVKVAKKHLSLGLEFLHEIIFKCRLPLEELERERGVILEEIKMRDDDPMVKVADAFVSQVYSLTPLGFEVIGTSENIKKMQRQEFLKHLKKWYQPENMVLAVAGGIEKVQEKVEKIFREKGNGFAIQPQELKFKQIKPQAQLIHKPIEQAHFCLGMRTFSYNHPERYVLAVLRTILGGNTSSRLWNEIRENRGLAYYVRTATDAYRETGYLTTQAGCATEKLAETIKLTLQEYAKIAREPVEDKELKLAKEYLKGRLALAFEDSQTVAGEYGESLLLEGKMRTLAEIYRQVEKVSAVKIQKTAEKIFVSSQLNLTIVGPFKNKEKFAKLLL
ncbi:MAG: pitrilysin family protein [Patescibacteria group bacterium]|nr:pitrilysin family protein [Patescibacteria group bacterium]